MTNTEIINKLIGKIRPIGESTEDKERLENLKTMCELVNDLVSQIDSVGYDFKDSPRYSEKIASQYAFKFLSETLGITE